MMFHGRGVWRRIANIGSWHVTEMCSSQRRSAIGVELKRKPTSASVRNRRVSTIALCPSKGQLTQPIAGTQPWRREQVFMPLCRR